MQRETIFFRIDGDGADTQLGTGTENPDGDLAPVRRHNLLELLDSHATSSRKQLCFYLNRSDRLKLK
jgi:hypothetical protein